VSLAKSIPVVPPLMTAILLRSSSEPPIGSLRKDRPPLEGELLVRRLDDLTIGHASLGRTCSGREALAFLPTAVVPSATRRQRQNGAPGRSTSAAWANRCSSTSAFGDLQVAVSVLGRIGKSGDAADPISASISEMPARVSSPLARRVRSVPGRCGPCSRFVASRHGIFKINKQNDRSPMTVDQHAIRRHDTGKRNVDRVRKCSTTHQQSIIEMQRS
jgi:hypothetical protein